MFSPTSSNDQCCNPNRRGIQPCGHSVCFTWWQMFPFIFTVSVERVTCRHFRVAPLIFWWSFETTSLQRSVSGHAVFQLCCVRLCFTWCTAGKWVDSFFTLVYICWRVIYLYTGVNFAGRVDLSLHWYNLCWHMSPLKVMCNPLRFPMPFMFCTLWYSIHFCFRRCDMKTCHLSPGPMFKKMRFHFNIL